MAIHPMLYWAQRSHATDESKNVVYLRIEVDDVSNPDMDLTPKGLKFRGVSNEDKKEYTFDIQFYDEIDVEKSKLQHDRHIKYILQKKNAKAEYWPHLTTNKKLPFVKTDFDLWVDEDEQESTLNDDALGGFGGMGGDPSNFDLSSLGGAGGMEGMDFSKMAGAGGFGGEDDDDDNEESDEQNPAEPTESPAAAAAESSDKSA